MEPVVSAPQAPAEPAPVEPVESAPKAPAEPAPVEPVESAPKAPAEPAPVEPVESAPQTTSPVEPASVPALDPRVLMAVAGKDPEVAAAMSHPTVRPLLGGLLTDPALASDPQVGLARAT